VVGEKTKYVQNTTGTRREHNSWDAGSESFLVRGRLRTGTAGTTIAEVAVQTPVEKGGQKGAKGSRVKKQAKGKQHHGSGELDCQEATQKKKRKKEDREKERKNPHLQKHRRKCVTSVGKGKGGG